MKIRKTIAATLLMGCMVSGTTAKTYYMAPNGSDANPGTQASPLATIARAQQLLAAGDTLFIRGGEYLIGANDIMSTQENIYACIFYFTKSGKAGKPICYFGYPGERPVFNLSRVKPAGKRVALPQFRGHGHPSNHHHAHAVGDVYHTPGQPPQHDRKHRRA